MTHPLVEVIDAERRKEGARGLRRVVPLAVVSGVLAVVGITAPSTSTSALPDPQVAENETKIRQLEAKNARQSTAINELKALLLVCVDDATRPECVTVPKGSTVLPVLQRLGTTDSDDDDDDDGEDDTRTVVVTPPVSSSPTTNPPKVTPTQPPKERERPNHRTAARHDGTSAGDSQGRDRDGS